MERSALQLPILVFGVVEVRRLLRELEALEEFIRQTAVREPGKHIALPRVSRLLDALATDNHRNLLQPADREELSEFLRHTGQSAPRVHISFATDPSSAFTAKLVAWLRSSIAPDILLEVGLQPTLAAGCIVRTKNKVFDLSLRERFADSGKLLLRALSLGETPPRAAGGQVSPAAPAPSPAPAPAVVAAPTSTGVPA